VLELVDFVHIPVLMDHKYFGQLGEGKHIEIPEAEVGIISGSIRNEEHLEVAQEMRRKCKIIVGFGTCATHGGIPALANSYTNDELFERYYTTETTDPVEQLPSEGIPPLLDAVYALDEKIKVDVYLPGCPPHPDQVFNALAALVGIMPLSLADKSVCDQCPTIREGKGQVKQLKRFLQSRSTKALTNLWTKCAACSNRGFCAWDRSPRPGAVETRSHPGVSVFECRAGDVTVQFSRMESVARHVERIGV